MAKLVYASHEKKFISDNHPRADRFGFSYSSAWSSSSTEDSTYQKHPNLRIDVSATGEVSQKVISSPQPVNQSSFDVNYQIAFLEKVFSSPWLRNYRNLGDCLLHALRGDEYPSDDLKTIPKGNFIQSRACFKDCPADPKNLTTYNGENFDIHLFITAENHQQPDSLVIYPFGQDQYYLESNLNDQEIIFSLFHPDEEEILGSAYGKLIFSKNQPIIQLRRVEDFSGNPITWQDVPIGTNLAASFSLKSAIYCHQNDLPFPPYFEGFPGNDQDYAHLYDNSIAIRISLPTESLDLSGRKFYTDIRGHSFDFIMGVYDYRRQNIGYVNVSLDSTGQAKITTDQEFPTAAYLYLDSPLKKEEVLPDKYLEPDKDASV